MIDKHLVSVPASEAGHVEGGPFKKTDLIKDEEDQDHRQLCKQKATPVFFGSGFLFSLFIYNPAMLVAKYLSPLPFVQMTNSCE